MTKVELTRRRILGGLVTIGAGSAAAGAGTFALFSDTENDSASFSAGTLNLTAGSTDGVQFTSSNVAPTQSGSGSIDLSQSSSDSFSADLNIGVGGVVSNESGGSSDNGDLDEQVELQVWVDEGQTGTLDSTDPVLTFDESGNPTVTEGASNYYPAANFEQTTWTDLTADSEFPVTVQVDWDFPNASDNNDAQGDDLTVNFEFTLEQRN